MMILVLFFLVSCMLGLHSGAGEGSPISLNLDEQKCFIQKDFKSPLLVGYKRDLSCGREGTEHHMIHYNNSRSRNGSNGDHNYHDDDDDDDDDGGSTETVKVTVRPIGNNNSNNNQTYVGNLVVVLSSTRRVNWKLRFHRVSYDTLVHLWISGHSRVLKETTRRMGIRHLPYSKNLHELRKRMRNELSDVKFNQYTVRRSAVVIKVGSGNRGCRMKPSRPVEAEGCVVPWSVEASAMKYMYVVEAIDPNPVGDPWSSMRDPTPVYVNLHPSNGRSMKVHVQLVLRSTRPVEWILQANKLKGVLDLIAEQQGDTSEVNMRNARFVNERLSHLTGHELIEWVSERYHSPVSYVRAVGANSFDISVESDLATYKPPREELSLLEENMVVDCQDGSLKIFILPHDQLKEDTFFLSDQLCPPTKSNGILWWNVTQDQCSTKRELNGTLHSKIFIRGDFESWIQVPVRCSLENLARLIEDPKNPQYTMKVFSDREMLNQFVSFPLMTNLGRSYYVTAALDAGLPLKVRLDSCVAKSHGNPPKIETLISNGCVTGKMIRRPSLPYLPLDQEGFEFIYRNLDSSRSLDIECNASACVQSRHVSVAGLEQCHALWKRSCQFSFPPESPINHIVSKTYMTPPIVAVHLGSFEGPEGGNGEEKKEEEGEGDEYLPEADVQTSPTTPRISTSPGRPPPAQQSPFDSTPREVPLPAATGCEPGRGPSGEGLVGITTVVCIAFAAFGIGVLLIGALWFIHSRTGPRKKKANLSSRCVPRPLQAKCADSNQGTLTNQACCPGFGNA